MKRALFIATTLAGLGMASVANAAEHEILILPDAYFPETTYLDPGDQVKFINESGDVHTIVASSGSWSIGPLNAGQEHILTIDNEIERTFHNANVLNSDGTYAVNGDISFDPSPID